MDKWRDDVYTWCKVHVVEGMDTCPWVYHHGFPLLLRGYGLPSDVSPDADPVSGMVCLLWVFSLDSA
jgi:hypothetical protein